jgi:hypothetical protein
MAVKIGALMLVPLQIPSRGEVYVSYGVYECEISHFSAEGEII